MTTSVPDANCTHCGGTGRIVIKGVSPEPCSWACSCVGPAKSELAKRESSVVEGEHLPRQAPPEMHIVIDTADANVTMSLERDFLTEVYRGYQVPFLGTLKYEHVTIIETYRDATTGEVSVVRYSDVNLSGTFATRARIS